MYHNKDYRSYHVPKAYTGGTYGFKNGTTAEANEYYKYSHGSDHTKGYNVSRRIRYRNFLSFDVYIIERSGLVTRIPKIDSIVAGGRNTFVVEKEFNQIKSACPDPSKIRDHYREHCNESERLSVKHCLLHRKNHSNKIDTTVISGRQNNKSTAYTEDDFMVYNYLTGQEISDIKTNSIYWAEQDIVLIFDYENDMVEEAYNILHPYSYDVKRYPNRKDFITGYEVLDKKDLYKMAFVYICNDDSIKSLWMPFGKQAEKIPIVKDERYVDGLQFHREEDKDNIKVNTIKTYTLEEAKKEFGISESYEIAVKFFEYDQLKQEREIKEKQLELEKFSLDSKEAEAKRKREEDDIKHQRAIEAEEHSRQALELKIAYEKEKQERTIKSDKANNSISLVKEIVGFCVAIIGIAAIIMKAKRK